MIHRIKTFAADENGAVTVDWVVLTAAVCGLALAAFASIQQGSRSVGHNVNGYPVNTDIEDMMDLDG